MRLKDRVALVTGSGLGIGRAIAAAFAREGAKIALNDIAEGALENTLLELRAAGAEAIAVPADVTDSKAVAEMVRQAHSHFGHIDILVNNAGGGADFSVHLLDVTEAMWDYTIDLNLKSVFLVSREVLPLMIAQGKGNIINISSFAARYGNERMRPHYSAAKAGVLGLTRHMAREFGPKGIRVNAVCPGYCVSTERIVRYWETHLADKERLLGEVALRRSCTPEEQAAVVLFLASDESSYMSGTTLDVAGGRVCI